MKYKIKVLCTAAAGALLTLAFGIFSFAGREQLWEMERPQYGEGDLEQRLQVRMGEKDYTVRLLLTETPMESEEVSKQLSEAAKLLEETMLNGNKDLQHIQTDLYLPSEFPGTSVQIQWYLDFWELIKPDGTVQGERIKEETPVRVQAVLSLQGETLEWEREMIVCPVTSPSPEQKIRMLQYQVQEAQEEASGTLALPDAVYGEPVSWYAQMDDRWMYMGMLTAAAVCLLVVGRRREEEQKEKERERSMQMDYPDIISRLSLYMNAGMSTRSAWERIADGYEKRRRKGSRPAYEEMLTTLHEMQSGVPETNAYERFGIRCRIPSYLKLGTLLGQNLRKGNKDLPRLLEEEAREAFEDRKALAKKLGEECESKLLFPMLLLLVTILVMVMYPAAVSFQF